MRDLREIMQETFWEMLPLMAVALVVGGLLIWWLESLASERSRRRVQESVDESLRLLAGAREEDERRLREEEALVSGRKA